ncbi:hypothetical protein ACFLSX_02855 [Calditrichota bacterium]
MSSIFKIEENHIVQLDSRQLHQILRRLLYLEAKQLGLVNKSIEVSLSIYIPDGGTDGKIEWQLGPQRGEFIPNTLSYFQCKSIKKNWTSANFVNELKTKSRSQVTLKKKIEKIFDEKGSYIYFIAQPMVDEQKQNAISEIRLFLKSIGRKDFSKIDIHIYDAGKIAEWVNNFLVAQFEILNYCGQQTVAGAIPYQVWQQLGKMRIPANYVVDAKRKEVIE